MIRPMIRPMRKVTAVAAVALLLVLVGACIKYGPGAAGGIGGFASSGGSEPDSGEADEGPGRLAGPQPRDYKQNEAIAIRDALHKPFNFHIAARDPGPVDPIALKTFLMVKTGAEVLWNRLPIHLETTLRRFPHHALYSDSAAVVAGREVVDVIQMLPKSIRDHDELTAWRVRQQVTEENWGWDATKVRVDASGWDTDKYKNVPVLVHAFQTAPASMEWFVMVDDDTYIQTDALAARLRGKNASEPWYIGSPVSISDGRVFAHGGSGIVVSRGAVEAMLRGRDAQALIDYYSGFAARVCCGDMVLAYPLADANVMLNTGLELDETLFEPFQGNSLVNTRLPAHGWCQQLISYHHMLPWEMQIMYDRENLRYHHRTPAERERGDLYTDFYQDFVLPFITSERQNWQIYPEGRDITEDIEVDADGGGTRTISPHKSKDDCIAACEAEPRCLGWELVLGEKCGLEIRGILRGEALNPSSKNWDDGTPVHTSGWMIDRIRRARAAAPCDPLEYDAATGEYNDSDETSEGWYFRLKG